MSVNSSLTATIVHVFRDVILPKKRSFLIVYCLLILSNFVPPVISYFLLSAIINIVLVYLYLNGEDDLPIDKIKEVLKENFLNVFKITILNLIIIAILTAIGLQIYSLLNGLRVFPLIILALLPLMIFVVGVVSLSVIHTIVENVKVVVAINRAIYTTKSNFGLIFKLIILFILIALVVSSHAFFLNFISIVLQLSLISIVVNSVSLGK
jgi:hypothetical protein